MSEQSHKPKLGLRSVSLTLQGYQGSIALSPKSWDSIAMPPQFWFCFRLVSAQLVLKHHAKMKWDGG